jgi:D-sedoheptulose 7-phosphate isomerase
MSRVEALSTRELLRRSVEEAVLVAEGLLDDSVMSAVEAATKEIVLSLREGGKVLLCGNGGSAADAQHLAAELIGRFCLDRRALPAIALADNIAAVTAIGNDYSYADVFVRGVRGLGGPGDVLIGLSTSGSSENVIAAFQAAREIGIVTVAFVGRADSALARGAVHTISVQGASTARIQEGHMLVGHTMFEMVERELCAAS